VQFEVNMAMRTVYTTSKPNQRDDVSVKNWTMRRDPNVVTVTILNSVAISIAFDSSLLCHENELVAATYERDREPLPSLDQI
jgi:hypothetical protein